MAEPVLLLAFAAAFLGGAALTSLALLRGWRGWLALKRLELDGPAAGTHGRIELAGLRERVRRLEAIADGRS
ncbi:hypothetical protein [Sphingosinicella sp. BN140058]|uniref:hypothetical protein n=1 Tax=Sphingosinicella sp. BN140058 TaxID=1892855 RepID=UPI00101059D2|nr:hypothetical protein [Sphingosinicella sp. BN140058]QAY78634.1 hypothetical protein ETR14_20395 [Sphingosinicella sp. BN140058]